MPSFNVVGDDDDRYEKSSRRSGRSKSVGEFESGMNIIYIVVIMGVVLLGALWFTNDECPTCPAIPACPELNVSQFNCPETTCPNLTCPTVVCTQQNTTSYVNLTESDCVDYVNNKVNLNTTMTIMNSTNYNMNVTYQMTKDSYGTYDTTELNATYLTEQLGEYWVIKTETR